MGRRTGRGGEGEAGSARQEGKWTGSGKGGGPGNRGIGEPGEREEITGRRFVEIFKKERKKEGGQARDGQARINASTRRGGARARAGNSSTATQRMEPGTANANANE